MDKRLTGALGERFAANWYIQNGYKLLALNYQTRFGEIDVILQKKNLIIFSEVKTRKNNKFYEAKEAVTYSKQQKIKTVASQYLAIHNMDDVEVRFDVVEIYTDENMNKINVIKNAFE